MTAILVKTGRVRLADVALVTIGGNWRLRLFQNNATVDEDTVIGDLTEATFSGYIEATPTFGGAAINGNDNAQADGSSETFTHSGGGTNNTIYGWYLVDNGSGDLVWAEKYGAPVSMNAGGLFITVQPFAYCGPLDPPL